MPTWLARMNATRTVSPDPVNAKSSMVASPVTRVCTGPANPPRPNGMRSSVARSVLLTQTALPLGAVGPDEAGAGQRRSPRPHHRAATAGPNPPDHTQHRVGDVQIPGPPVQRQPVRQTGHR